MIPRFLLLAALALAALPTFALPPAKPLTPPDVLSKAKTIQVTVTLFQHGKTVEVSKATLAQPNKAYIVDTDGTTQAVDTVYVSDGHTEMEYDASRKTCVKSTAPARMVDLDTHTFALSQISTFLMSSGMSNFTLEPNTATDPAGVSRYRYAFGSGDQQSEELLIVNTRTGLPVRLDMYTVKLSKTKPIWYVRFTDWKLNTPLDESKFIYTPPADAKLIAMLANGVTAPDFTVQNKDGKPVKLSDYRGKTIVLDFWATWCGPCQSSLPHTAEVAKKYAAKNVVVLAVNVWDTPKAFQTWLPKHPEYAGLNFAIDPSPDQEKSVATALYGVSGIPTQYVIDPGGKVIKSIVGYEPGDTELEDVLKTAGS